MKKFSFTILALILLTFTNSGKRCSNIYWVRLEYTGDVSKPFPIVIIYTGNSITTTISADTTVEDLVALKINVSEKDFFKIIGSIKKISFTSPYSQLKDSFAVVIQQNDKREILKTANVSEIKQVFDSVLVRLKGHENIWDIESYINQFRKRLGISRLRQKIGIYQKMFANDERLVIRRKELTSA